MKTKRSSITLIVISLIIFLTGMASKMERTHSYLPMHYYTEKTDIMDILKNDTLVIHPCPDMVSKSVISTKSTLQKMRKGRSFFNSFEDLKRIKKLLQLTTNTGIVFLFIHKLTERNKVVMLNYIHNQDGEKGKTYLYFVCNVDVTKESRLWK